MSVSSESAEQFIKLYLDGAEFALKISGTATKNIIAALYAISKESNKSRGKIRLTSMLKSDKEQKIFSIKSQDMKVFAKEAKSYGVLYCALVNKKNKNYDGMIDIMVRAEDAPKVNRIIERYNLSTVDKASIIKSEIEKEMANKEEQKDLSENAQDIGVQEKDIDDKMIDDIFSKPIQKEEISNPTESQTEKSPPLEPSSTSKIQSDGVAKPLEKRSVRKDLEKYKAEERLETELKKAQLDKDVNIQSKNLNPIQSQEKVQTKSIVQTPNIVKKERGK